LSARAVYIAAMSRAHAGVLVVLLLGACAQSAGQKRQASPFAPTAPAFDADEIGAAVDGALVGLMCLPAGQPARLWVIAVRDAGWHDQPGEVQRLVRGQADRPFLVLSATGGRAGVWNGVGVIDPRGPTLGGGYAGAAACLPEDGRCLRARGQCALAVASLGEDGRAEPPRLATGGACLEGDSLAVDVDGDGQREVFDARALDALPDELPLVARTSACTPSFVATWPGLVLLGVVDVDGDARQEIVVGRVGERGDVERVAIYAAVGKAGRLRKVSDREAPITSP
jgi:hypothetical protein